MENIADSRLSGLLLEAMADGVFTLNENGFITSWNSSMTRISGYLPKEVIGKPCTVLSFNRCLGKKCPAGSGECGIFQEGAVDSKECTLRHKEGNEVHVLKSARLIKDENGVVVGVVETIADLTELFRMRKEVEEANRRLREIHQFSNIIGKSHVMRQVFSSIRAAAESDVSVLILGESGTGKELVAGAIHYNSLRAESPLVTVNCSALSESLLESELFGHVRGAFTGAIRDRSGRFEEASGGTVFLDEIGEISPLIQVKLLRVLQEKEIERVGESRRRKIDIRIIAATNKDLLSQIRGGMFREDLYYRLKVFPIHVPPLRKRKDDIHLLVNHFMALYNRKTGKTIVGASPEAMRIFMDYHWPGNVRELENAIEHAFVLCTGNEIQVFDLPVEIRQTEYALSDDSHSPMTMLSGPARTKLTREILLDLLEECRWNKAEVARRAKKSRTAIWKYMKKWNIPLDKPPVRIDY